MTNQTALPSTRNSNSVKPSINYFLVLFLAILTGSFSTTSVQSAILFSNLVSFNNTNGYNPTSQLLQTADGTFYGTTLYGGTYSKGTIFKLATNFTLTSLVSFNNTNGSQPSILIQGLDGLLYGTSASGGPYTTQDSAGFNQGFGTIFQSTTNGSLTTVASFIGTNGSNPSGLVQASNGTFFGTYKLGPNASNSITGNGGIFSFKTNGVISNLFSFAGGNGSNPSMPPVLGTNGLYYGFTPIGGAGNIGSLFDISTNAVFTSLLSFNGANGYTPSGLFLSKDGNFYGTAAGSVSDFGSIFRLKHDGTLTTLASFNNTNGAKPVSMVQATDGNFYGVTSQGGFYNAGTIFQLLTNGNTLVLLYSFTGTSDGSTPTSLIQGKDGNFYGTTSYGGNFGLGNVFKLSVIPTPVIQNVAKTNATVSFNFTSLSNHTYEVQYTTNLPNTNWLFLKTVAATNNLTPVSDTPGTAIRRFYRIMIVN